MIEVPDFLAPPSRDSILRAAFESATLRFRRRVSGAAMPDFGDWLMQGRPEHEWTAPHFRVMQHHLDKVTRCEQRRVFFSVPIRHGKTEHNTISYAAYRLEHDPTFRWIIATYNQRQADKLSREIRKLAVARSVVMSKDRNSASEWETAAGGGVRAVGAGAGVASVNADGIIVDDPIGSRSEAESQADRDRVYDWISNDLLARTEPHTFVLFTMSRWHKDDPAGRIMDRQRELWTIVDMPGRAEEHDPLGRALHAPLWPEFRGEQWLLEKRIELGEYGFASLIQGRPRPREGGMFKWDWWKLVDEIPKMGRMIRYVDPAGTEPKPKKNDPDFTAATLVMRMPDARTMVVDCTAFKKSVAARDATLVQLARDDMKKYPGRVVWWLEIEVGISGEDRTRDLMRAIQNVGIPVYSEHATGSKVIRVEPLASMAEAGNLVLGPGEWRDAFRLEACDFPNGIHDDRIDSAAGAVAKLGMPIASVGFSTVRI